VISDQSSDQSINSPMSITTTKTVGAYEAKTKLSALLDLVERGREVVITRHEHPVARLVPAGSAASGDKTVFERIRSLHSRLSLAKGESAKELIEAGRRI
jgi:prevent-host-death family protein